MAVPVSYYLILSAMLFAIGVTGVLIRRNAIVIFMCIELMLNAVNLLFVTMARYMGSGSGQVFVFFVMAVSAAEFSGMVRWAVAPSLNSGFSFRSRTLMITGTV